jgi:preprotein translocase subunit SecB
MKAIPSEIKLEQFSILQSHYTYIVPKKRIKDIKSLLDEYEIDIDFAHQSNENKSIKVFTKIGVNNCDNPAPGYQLIIEGVAVFSFSETENLDEKQKNNLKFYSTVNIIIGYLRNCLASMTASSPLGQYLLPPININDLFIKKADQNKVEKN